MNKQTSLQRGKFWEQKAKIYLEDKGLIWQCSNYHCRNGEIDLVMREAKTWVFVEVKFRSHTEYGHAAEMFTPAKRQKCIKAMQFYMHEQGLNPALVDHRLDLIAIDGDTIEWFKSV